jgi:hypothetical protein
MKKKLLLGMLLATALSSGGLFALGIGAQAGYVAGPNHASMALTLKLAPAPWVFAFTLDGLSSNHLGIGITADNWVVTEKIAGPFSFFGGLGVAGSVHMADERYISLFAGGRALVGVNVFVVPNIFELYTQIAWQPGLQFYSNDQNRVDFVLLSFPVNVGFRFWI